MFIDGTSVI